MLLCDTSTSFNMLLTGCPASFTLGAKLQLSNSLASCKHVSTTSNVSGDHESDPHLALEVFASVCRLDLSDAELM